MGKGGNSDEESEEEEDDECPENPGYGAMFKAENARKFLGKSWVVFSAFFSIYYLLQFALALGCANYYSMSEEVRLDRWEFIPELGTDKQWNSPLQPCTINGWTKGDDEGDKVKWL